LKGVNETLILIRENNLYHQIMKKVFFLILATMLTLTCFSQGDKKKGGMNNGAIKIDAKQVPDAVKNAFTIQATDLRWEKKESKSKEGKVKVRYVAVYTQDGVRARARFKEDGTALSSTRYLEAQQLPTAVQTAATTKNSGAKLMGGEEVTTKKREIYYRVRLKNSGGKVVSFYDVTGAEVKKDKIDDDSKEEEEN
jgi:major membrane immunogen (membrane-anchored lipoprotein)